MRILGILLGSLCVAWALYTVLAPKNNYTFWRPFLFHPFPFEPGMENPPVLDGIAGEDIVLSVSDRKINGWYYRVPESAKTILFSHGNSGNISYRVALCQLMIQAGASVFVYDYAGFGKSTGIPSLEGIVEDGAAAWNWLVQQGVSPQTIILYGESLGAAVAMQLSVLVECCGVIIQSGFASLRRIALELYPFVRIYSENHFPDQRLDTLSLLIKPHQPLLIIHGVLDQVVPFKHAEDMYQAAIGTKKFLRLDGTGHNDIVSTAAEEYIEALREFIVSAHRNGDSTAQVSEAFISD